MNIELKNKTVRCRKRHRCEWCGEWINAGEQAQYRTGIHEGDFVSGHQHLECHDAMVRSDYEDFDDGSFYPGEQRRGKTMAESHGS